MSKLQQFVDTNGYLPLAWAGSTLEMNYLNWGDALSPVMVAIMSGLPIKRVPTRSGSTRMGAVGTIGHGFDLGDITFWGTGSSEWRNPGAPAAERQKFAPSEGTTITVAATRGPISRRILGGDGPGVYGDPVWLLPRFHDTPVEKTHELGIILHLSELDGRALDAGPSGSIRRAHIGEAFQGAIKTINTLTAIDAAALGEKTDEIRRCKRIVSTSLHGMVVAESYGIPCLYFSPRGAQRGVSVEALDQDWIDLRIRDLYTGLGLSEVPFYVQPRDQESDFAAICDAIDRTWTRKTLDDEALMTAFPLDTRPIDIGTDGLWLHPAIQAIQFQHDVAALRKADALANKAAN